MLVERDLDIPSSVADNLRELQINTCGNDVDPLIAYIDSYVLFHWSCLTVFPEGAHHYLRKLQHSFSKG